MIASAPEPGVAVPAPIARIAGDRTVRAVWRNEVDGLTFEIGTDPDRIFAKWQPHSRIVDLAGEADRLRWAASFICVPTVLDLGTDQDAQWLVTAALPGHSAVAPRWLADPATVADCPYSWTVVQRLATIDRAGVRDSIDWDPAHRRLGAQRALELLRDPPPIDRDVVCHGDPCSPNTLLSEDGECSGRVDLGALGVGDRWADLAVAAWSTEWNYGPGWADALLEAYGIAPDEQRCSYYRLLWDLSP